MLRVSVSKIRPGMKLALPVKNPAVPTRTLLRAGFELDPETGKKLEAKGVRVVWVAYPNMDFMRKYLSPALIEKQAEVTQQIADAFTALQADCTARLEYDTYTKNIEALMDQLLTQPVPAVFLGDLAATDDQLTRHSSAVAYLSLLMGLKTECYLVKERKHIEPGRAKQVVNLGLGAMLHDIGYAKLDEQTRGRYLKTGDETDPAWREHTALGYEAVRGKIDPSAATVVLHHHQKWDGSGFAGAKFPVLREHRIHVFARIAGVANLFDRLHNPVGGRTRPVVRVLRMLMEEPWSSRLDPLVVQALIAVVPPYPPGSLVRLSDMRTAVVVDHHPDAPCRPVVQPIEEDDFEHAESDESDQTGEGDAGGHAGIEGEGGAAGPGSEREDPFAFPDDDTDRRDILADDPPGFAASAHDTTAIEATAPSADPNGERSKPTEAGESEFIDLLKEPLSLRIIEHEGVDVRELNFSLPPALRNLQFSA